MNRPVHTFGRLDLATVRGWMDGTPVTEWLGGQPLTVVRMRTEQYTPVPASAGDWARLEAWLDGAR